MISTIFNIVTRYTARDAGASRVAGGLAKDADALAGSLDRAERKASGLGSILKGVVGLGIGAGFGKLIGYAGSLARKSEEAQIQLASVFAVNKVHTFNAGLVRSRQLLEKFNAASATSPGTGADFQAIFKAAAPTLLSNVKGITDEEITRFAGRGLGAAFTLRAGAGTEQVGSELNQILAGQAGADNQLFSSIKTQLFKNLGIKKTGSKGTELFNKKAAAEGRKTFEALLTTLADLDQANAAFGQTVTGLFGTLKQQANDLTNKAFSPLFKEMKSDFSAFVGEVTGGKKELTEVAKLVGGKLAGAWNLVKTLMRGVNDNLKLFILLAGGAAMRRASIAIASSAAFGGVGVGAGGLARGYVGGVLGAGARAKAAGGGLLRRGGGAIGRGVGGALGFAGDFLFAGALGSAPGKARAGGRLASGLGRLGGAGRLALAQSGGSLIGAGVNLGKAGVKNAGGAIAARTLGMRAAFGTAVVRGGGLAGAAAPLLAAGAGKTAGLAAGAIKGLTIGLAKFAFVAAPLVIIAGMLAGTFLVLKDNTSEATQFLMTSFSELRVSLDSVAMQFGFAGGAGTLGGNLKTFAKWLGTGVVGVLGLAVKGAERLVTGFGVLVSVMQAIGLTITGISKGGLSSFGNIGGMFSTNFEASEQARKAAVISAMVKEKERRARIEKDKKDKAAKDAASKKAAAAAAAALKKQKEAALKGKTSVKIDIKNDIKISTEADPDRVAIRIEQINSTSMLDALQTVDLPFDLGS